MKKATKIDKILMNYLFDYQNMFNSNSDKADLYEKEANKIFKKNLYSHIDVQDERGNTFLHYAIQSGSSFWLDKILRAGASPDIENNEGLTAVIGFKQRKVYNSFFSSINRDLRLDERFNKITQGFHLSLKQILLNDKLKDVNFFATIEVCEKFLKSINLFNEFNAVNIVFKSFLVPNEDKVSYLNNFDKPKINSHFLCLLIKDDTKNSVIKDLSVSHLLNKKLLEKDFEINDEFNKTLKNFFSVKISNKKQEILTTIIKIMLKSNYDFNIHVSEQETIEDKILKDSLAKKIYLKEKLSMNLVDKSEKIKKIKI